MRTSTLEATPPSRATKRPQLARALQIARITHPFPTLLNVAATAGLSFVAAGGWPDGSTLARMLAVMLFAQCAIGVTNDIFDRELDAATKPWKPVAAGLVSMRTAWWLASGFALSSALLAATLGAASFALAMLGLACGIAYDVRLKRTLFSAVPYMIAIPTLPTWVWVTLDAWEPALWWLWPIGGLIGLSVHLANTLPDLDDDAQHGVRGMAHALGANRTRALAWGSFALALVCAVAAGVIHEAEAVLLIAAIGSAAGALALAIALHFARRDAMAAQIGFGLLGVGAAVAATGWLAAVT